MAGSTQRPCDTHQICPLLKVNRPCHLAAVTSQFDPIRKSGTRFCCAAQDWLPVIVSTCSTGRQGTLPMRRREFIMLLGGAAIALPLSARAQERMRLVGALTTLGEDDPEAKRWFAAFQEGLQRLGWEEGRNIRIEYHSAGGDQHRLRTYAAELVGMAPDVLLAAATPVLVVLQQETRSVPIVFAQVSDPVKLGFVANLVRPGGNMTGCANFEHSI